LGNGRFEAEAPREPHALSPHMIEHFASLSAVVSGIERLERLMPNRPKRY
jgi:hypothetical protein